MFGDEIKVVILEVRKNKVKFGIHAPREVTVSRVTATAEKSTNSIIPESSATTAEDTDEQAEPEVHYADALTDR
jgi:carbon storage regulator CsrA